MFEVIVKKRFSASHTLKNYKGKDEAPHSHDWTIEAKIGSLKLDMSGCAVDFHDIDRAMDEILKPFSGGTIDEKMIKASPSAENFAKHIFEKLSSSLKNGGAQLISITAWEDEEHGATYTEI